MDNVVCSRCAGTGEDCWDEADERIYDTCYSCHGSGKVSGAQAREQKLYDVCEFIGRLKAQDYRNAVNSDPEGEGFDFMAAESGISAWEYFQIKVDQHTNEVAIAMDLKSTEDQDALIAMYDAVNAA